MQTQTSKRKVGRPENDVDRPRSFCTDAKAMTSTTTMTAAITGIACSCGSFNTKVLRTTASAGYIVRRRECASCGERITTTEREIHTPPATRSVLTEISIGQIRASLDLLADLASGNSAEPKN